MRAVLGLSVLGAASAASPIEKVMQVLRDLKGELEADTKKDAKWWNKTECQCDSDEEKNAKTISDAGDAINSAQQSMDKNNGVTEESKTRIAQLEEDLQSTTNERRDKQKKREKDVAAYNLFQQDCSSVIQGLQNALTVLCDGGTGVEGFLQVTKAQKSAAITALPKIYNRYVKESPGSMTPVERQTLESFLQQDFGTQNSNTGVICGTLEGMADTYKKDCGESKAKEIEDKVAHDEGMGLLQKQLDDMSAEHKNKKSRLGAAMEAFSNAKKAHRENTKIREDTTKMEADRAKLCAELKHDYEIRTKERADELSGVVEALNILDDPATNAQLMAGEGSTDFLQVSKADRRRGTAAREMIQKSLLGKKKSPQLLKLMQQLSGAGNEAFGKILTEIDNLVKQLEDKIKKDSADRDACIAGIAKLTQTQQSNQNDLQKLGEEIDTLKVNIETLETEIEGIMTAIDELKAAMKKASEERQEENAAHQDRMHELHAAVKILQKVLNVLRNAYVKKDATPAAAGLLQQPSAQGMAGAEKKKGGNKAITMIENIVSEMKAEMKDASAMDASQSTNYENLFTEQNQTLTDMNQNMAQKKEEKSKAEQKLTATEEQAKDMSNTLDNTTQSKNSLQGECDFLLNNFTIMQEHNQNEIEAMKQAHAYLRGMK